MSWSKLMNAIFSEWPLKRSEMMELKMGIPVSRTTAGDDFFGDKKMMGRDQDYKDATRNSRENKNLVHPADLPEFNWNSHEPVWYLSHPLAPDDVHTFQENMDDVLRILRLCFDCGVRVVAPYHTICLALDDANEEHRRIGLEVDCTIARLLGRIILSGHKLSKGMNCEVEAAMQCKSGFYMLDIRCLKDVEIRDRLQSL